jgi:hypothetical protein
MAYKKKGYFKRPPGEAAKTEVYGRYKSGARIRGYEFNLSMEEFEKLTQMLCHYCGDDPNNKASTHVSTGFFYYNGIDRKDNSLGYFKENCVPCCRVCNRAKQAMSYDDFVTWISRVVEFNKENDK